MSALEKLLETVPRFDRFDSLLQFVGEIKQGVKCYQLNHDGKPLKVFFKGSENRQRRVGVWVEGREDNGFWNFDHGKWECAGVYENKLYFIRELEEKEKPRTQNHFADAFRAHFQPFIAEKYELYVLVIGRGFSLDNETHGIPIGTALFALQQPFYIEHDSFQGFHYCVPRRPVPSILVEYQSTNKKFEFCYHEGKIVVIVCSGEASLPVISEKEDCVHIDFPSEIGLPTSIISHEDRLYVMCGKLLLIFQKFLLSSVISFESEFHLGGVFDGIILFTYYCTQFTIDSRKASIPEEHVIYMNGKTIDQLIEEQRIKNAAYTCKLKENNKTLRYEIEKLNSVKTAHGAEIARLKEEMSVKLERYEGEERRNFVSKFFDEYNVKEILGEGAFGCVFRADNRYDCGTYAVKRVAVDASKTTIDKALGEVRAMAQLLDHPGIVRYNSTWVEKPPERWQFDADVEMLKKMDSSQKRLKMNYKDDCVFIYIQMQMCNFSLEKWLENNQETSLRPITRMKSWFKQVASAVAYIHEKNLIHRDLKPSNILFLEADKLKLCDLGIATQRAVADGVETAVTRTNVGTALYMSPEQGTVIPTYSSMTDVFALGLILAELCIVMAAEERFTIFDNYRHGTQSDRISDKLTTEFVKKLTRMEPKSRPTSREMLDDIYLS